MNNYKIGILGMGGVGGYLGVTLAAARLDGVDIIFIARGETQKLIKQSGLKLITDSGEMVEHGQLVSDDPDEIGRLDLLICAVKFYDLENSLTRYTACLDEDSIVLPLLNGIDIALQVKKILPRPQIWEGCIYLVARKVGRGIIRQTGPAGQLFFGSSAPKNEKLQAIEQLLKKGGLLADVSVDIDAELWRKFFFISVLGTVTSYYNGPIGFVQGDSERMAQVKLMIGELEHVALAKGVHLPQGLANATYQRLLTLAPGATSSMYDDFRRPGPTELEQLTGDVVRFGKEFGIPTPVYEQLYRALIR